MFDKIHSARLTELANHLTTAERLLVGKFNFRVYCKMDECGSMGCAIGEASKLWPEAFPTDEYGLVDYGQSGRELFGLSMSEFHHLFIPRLQQPSLFGGQHLGGTVSRQQVACNIKAFLEHKTGEL